MDVRFRIALATIPFVASLAAVPPPSPPGDVIALGADLRVRAEAGREIVLEVRASKGEGFEAIARRVARSAHDARAIAAANRGRLPEAGSFVSVPFLVLSDEIRPMVLLNVFPGDRAEPDAWIHVARSAALPLFDEGLWQVAEWFAGEGSDFPEIQRANGLDSPEVVPGREIRIPRALLHTSLRPLLPSADGVLPLGRDARGEFAGYRLRPGEALYSAVVLRFTGATSTEDVDSAVRTIASRSGIREPREIPVGWLVKIPVDLLEPDFLPPDHPRRRKKEADKEAMARELVERPPPEARDRLRGVLVIVDPGHGGQDIGTANNGVWEHDYVYDVACRLKAALERDTAAEVEMTLLDLETGCSPSDGDPVVANRQGTIRTDPPFLADGEGDTAVAVNLRWYLANALYRRALKRGIHPDRVVFLSLHADSRHPSLRGLMVYVPGAAYRAGTYGHSSETYSRFAEVREKPRVSFSGKERIRSEAVSRRLASRLVAAFRREGLPVQQYQPIRERVIRGGRPWLPAVLRGNAVPTKVLVEMVNLANTEDAALLSRSAARERLAAALAGALVDAYAERPEPKRGSKPARRG